MITHRRVGIVRPNPRYANIADVNDVPHSVRAAVSDPAWHTAMLDEVQAL